MPHSFRLVVKQENTQVKFLTSQNTSVDLVKHQKQDDSLAYFTKCYAIIIAGGYLGCVRLDGYR